MSSISLILCTYNRSWSLAKALESVAASTLLDSVGWDVWVVDNNSTDQTREVIEDFCRRYPGRFHYMFEPKQGKSHALNAAIQAATGEVLAFTDDDVIVEPGWLKNLTAPLDDSKWSGTAGRISLGTDFSPPPWLAIRGAFSLGSSLVQFDEGDTQVELTKAPFGANMAFRKRMFEKYGNFRTDLGRKGRGLIGNEDTEFGERLMVAGERLCYVPSALVNHPVTPGRLTKRYIRAYWFYYGRSVARQAGEQLPLWIIPLRYLRRFIRRLKWMFSVNRRWVWSPHARFFCEVHALMAVGQIVESYRQSFQANLSSMIFRKGAKENPADLNHQAKSGRGSFKPGASQSS
jgi:glycosyltransferase involved in cell wall biosynthesis